MINNPDHREQVIKDINQYVGPFIGRFMANSEALNRGAEMAVTLATRLREIPLPVLDEKVLVVVATPLVMHLPNALIKVKDAVIDILVGLDGAGHN